MLNRVIKVHIMALTLLVPVALFAANPNVDSVGTVNKLTAGEKSVAETSAESAGQDYQQQLKVTAAALAAEKAAAEKAAAEKAAAEKAAAEKAAAEKAAAEKAAAEKAAAEKAAAEKAAAEKAAAEKAAAEKAAAEKAAAEKAAAEKSAAEKAAAEKAAAEKAAAEKAAAEKAAAEKAAAEKAAAEKAAAEKAAAEKAAAEKAAAEKAAAEKAAAEKAAAEKAAAEKAAAEKAAAEKAAAEKAAAEKAAAREAAAKVAVASLQNYQKQLLEMSKHLAGEKSNAELLAVKRTAEKVAAEKMEAERIAAEKLAVEKAEAIAAAEKAVADKLAAERAAAERAAAERAAAERAAAERTAAERAAAERAAAERAAAERAAAERAAAERAAAERAAAEAGAIEDAPADVVVEKSPPAAEKKPFVDLWDRETTAYEPGIIYRDEFDGGYLSEVWQVLNPRSELMNSDGESLILMTNKSSLSKGLVPNVLVYNGSSLNGDYSVSVRVDSEFTAGKNGRAEQQAGLLLYRSGSDHIGLIVGVEDEANFSKCEGRDCRQVVSARFVKALDGERVQINSPYWVAWQKPKSTSMATRFSVYLKIDKVGYTYTAHASLDGNTWYEIGAVPFFSTKLKPALFASGNEDFPYALVKLDHLVIKELQ
ncbi:Histone H1-like nucleoprotein HC2 [Mariprofundus ferrinatatus]|uniref:Histone H1-like nucleoprotein HC2 n=1 Tax=Mariprofundus ferrinatatus TaxID=1921087 RepID=A0A2K8L282_9PROT|nr:histone H1-like repetitive region-containing protein [Mariprofundus ferrinatatus]ATX81397.1 Histone H1-like nucleoprotein HC2 [Mariprofundus ferrinatatus]